MWVFPAVGIHGWLIKVYDSCFMLVNPSIWETRILASQLLLWFNPKTVLSRILRLHVPVRIPIPNNSVCRPKGRALRCPSPVRTSRTHLSPQEAPSHPCKWDITARSHSPVLRFIVRDIMIATRVQTTSHARGHPSRARGGPLSPNAGLGRPVTRMWPPRA